MPKNFSVISRVPWIVEIHDTFLDFKLKIDAFTFDMGSFYSKLIFKVLFIMPLTNFVILAGPWGCKNAPQNASPH